MEETKTSEEWYTQEFRDTVGTILDPDGWDRTNYQYSWYEEKITKKEFDIRAMASTGMWLPPKGDR